MSKESNNILKGDFQILKSRIFSEKFLKELSVDVSSLPDFGDLILKIISKIPIFGYFYDWNCGSLLQHLDVSIISELLKKLNLSDFYSSVGLAWVLGELKSKDPIISSFLYDVVKFSKNPESWWLAALSLERLGLEPAIGYLKLNIGDDKEKYTLEYCLNNLDDKKSVIGILLVSSAENTERIILPEIKKQLMNSENIKIIINCCWFVGRFRFMDQEIFKKLQELLSDKNYELQYNCMLAISENASEKFLPLLEKYLNHSDPLIRRMSVRSIANISDFNSIRTLERQLIKEKSEKVIGELTKAIYSFKNPDIRKKALLLKTSTWNENGMIKDDSDKWYGDPFLYNIFSESEDPENLCFDIIENCLKKKKIENPIDLASGTGRMAWQILNHLDFKGAIHCVDASDKMCDFIMKRMQRDSRAINKIKVINSTIEKSQSHLSGIKTNFIISSFGFPSRITDKSLTERELTVVVSMLNDDGLFFTIGWDENFNDELSEMWFRYVPDAIKARNFEEWRRKRSEAIKSARNCGLSWLKKGIAVPLQFSSIEQCANVMGHLFGKEAAYNIIESNKTSWSMSLGITCNTKHDLVKIIGKI